VTAIGRREIDDDVAIELVGRHDVSAAFAAQRAIGAARHRLRCW
jgi:hypothetical protein